METNPVLTDISGRSAAFTVRAPELRTGEIGYVKAPLLQLNVERLSLYNNFGDDPERFANNMYSFRVEGGYFTRQRVVRSAIFTVDNPALCSLIDVDVLNGLVSGTPLLCNTTIVKKIADDGTADAVFEVSCKENMEEKSILKMRRVDTPFVSYEKDPPTSLKKLLQQDDKLKMCLFGDITRFNYLGCDKFTTEVLVNYMLDFIYKQPGLVPTANNSNGSAVDANLYGIVPYYGFTMCNMDNKYYGLILQVFADKGSLIDFMSADDTRANFFKTKTFVTDSTSTDFSAQVPDANFVYEIYAQVIANLHFIQMNAQFNHGDLTVDHIVVTSIPTSINYLDVTTSSPFRCHIISLGQASMSITAADPNAVSTNPNKPATQIIRIYNNTKSANRYLQVAPFTTDIGSGSSIAGQTISEPWFKVNNRYTWQMLIKARHTGVPFYLAWDSYVFTLSYLLIPEIYLSFFGTENSSLREIIWNTLWFPEDLPIVTKRYTDAIRKALPNNISTIFTIIKGIKLKCRLTIDLMKALNYNNFSS